jgi:hypothetical protein
MNYERIVPPDQILFGQFLVDKKKITFDKLKSALEIQAKERDKTMKESHRLLGQILLQDFKVFESRIELNKYLNEFHEYKSDMEQMYYELHNLREKK